MFRFGRIQWLSFFGGILLLWALLFSMAIPEDLRLMEATYGADLIAFLCGGGAGAASGWGIFAMWVLMAAGMMAPTALPAFATYDDLGGVTRTGFARLLGGYLTVWIGFSALAAMAQIALFELGLIGQLGQSLNTWLTAALLVGAGLYQFSSLKGACVSRCRQPILFFMEHWEEGPFRNGLRLGLDCVGCCWALMALGFVGGVMNLAFMGMAMVVMTLEKLPDIGRYLTRPLGVGLVLAGLAVPLL